MPRKIELAEFAASLKRKTPESSEFSRKTASHGKPAALNFALTQITGEFVGVFDADSVPERAVLRKYCLTLRTTPFQLFRQALLH